jgi:hypothetical protein
MPILLATAAVVASSLSLGPATPVLAEDGDPADALAAEVAAAIVDQPSFVAGASFPELAAPEAVMTQGSRVASFPTVPGEFAVLSTGRASRLEEENGSGGDGDSLAGPSPSRGNSAEDVTVLKIDLHVPQSANCLVGLDFRFLSEEYPEYVGSAYNDAFIAELDKSTWTTQGSTIIAPDNFAFDPDGNPITINTVGALSMTQEAAEGTTFDGSTPSLTAATPITPGAHSLYLSIFDQGDSALDSAVLVDNLRLGSVAPENCKPGAVLAGGTYVALGDSYSSGFGVAPYEASSHVEGGNDCQRSDRAYGSLVAEELGYRLYDEQGEHFTFKACQGGVTRDFYHPRDGEEGNWGEVPQLDHLSDNTELVTFSIGGNDVEFAKHYTECLAGFEFLIWNTCSGDEKVDDALTDSFNRLSGYAAKDDRLEKIVPFGTLYGDVVERAPYSTRVVMGYPQFFPETGADTTFRCKLIKRVDQAYFYARTRELTESVIAPAAAQNGFLVADPGPKFVGHEFCGDNPWFFGLTEPGKVHPIAEGHHAMAETVLDALAADPRERFVVSPEESEEYSVKVERRLQSLSAFIQWPGSDVVLSLVSPSGTVYTRDSTEPGVVQAHGPTWDKLVVPNPEQGEWTVRMYGADVDPGGEEVPLSVGQQQVANERPVPAFDLTYDGTTLALDASSSRDADGEITTYRWFVDNGETETVREGRQASIELPAGRPMAVSLQVKDDRGDSEFLTKRFAAIDVMPAAEVATVNPTSNGVTPVAVLSFEGFDATALDVATLRFGHGKVAPKATGVNRRDVDGDGVRDLVVEVPTLEMGIRPGDTSLCMTGVTKDGETFLGCDGIRQVPEG